MKSFIQHIVDELDSQSPLLLKDMCFVFPSRRACVYFNDLLQKKFKNSILWAPTVLSIEEFVQQHTPDTTVVDEIRLLFKLFEVYKKSAPEITFDTFYAWGQTLLKDFDEVDRYLVDVDLLYKNLQEIENIDEVFGPDEEVIKAIKGFQQVINTSQEGKLYKKFNATWTLVGRVYKQFRAELLSDGWAYNGMCYRILAENLVDGSSELPYQQIVFAGFNALSKAEEQIFESLLNKGQAKVYIDADRYYLEDEKEEAGYFLRKMQKLWRNNDNVKWILADDFKQPKSIKILGVSQKIAQARAAALRIEETKSESTKTAIVLADESLLLPVLYALPAQNSNLNVTMGYPVAGTATGNLIKAFLRYQASASGTHEKYFVNIKAYNDLQNQSVVMPLVSKEMVSLGHSNSHYMSWQAISEKITLANDAHQNILIQLFRPIGKVNEALKTIYQAILNLYLLNTDSETTHEVLEERVIYSLVKYLQNLQVIIDETTLKISFSTLEKIIQESFKQITTPFAGEPLASLQVMGFLETRALDFENLIILSVNEDLLPASGNSKTYIPFGIRKAFQLPTFLEHNSIYAYHFFRLLQRAKNISLIYSTQLSVTGSGEKSRFILQLLNRFGDNKSPIHIEHVNLLPQHSPATNSQGALFFEKTGIVKNQLEEHISSFSHERPLSPTALVDYLSCSLKYYFARILGIREPEEPVSEIDARIFGNILHDILEKVYEPWVGKEITKADLEHLIKHRLPEIIIETFSQYDKNSGEISFTKHVVLHLAKRILQNDIKDAPIKIIDLESRANPLIYDLPIGDNQKITLGGKIDRLDQIIIDNQTVTRVLDYKTGRVELKSPFFRRQELSIEDYMQAHFEEPKYKSGFQIYFYSLLHKRNLPDQAINGGIISVKKLGKGVEYLRQDNQPINDDIIDEFENNLINLINDLINMDVAFKQTEDIDRCKYCDFKTICGR